MQRSSRLINAAQRLSQEVSALSFAPPITHVYNPLDYAWAGHQAYVQRFADLASDAPKKIVFLGMNPGPFGMVQCGVPFGEITAVRDWMGITTDIKRPELENPKRPIEGFACLRSEVSGRRLWALFQERFGSANAFFNEHFVANYCPLAFFTAGRNITPDKLPSQEQALLYAACDAHLRSLVDSLQAEWVIGIGAFAQARASQALAGQNVRIGKILHPSPASPAANRGWSAVASRQLAELGLWS